MDPDFDNAKSGPRRASFLGRLAVGALVVALVLAALVNLVDPKTFGIDSESGRILYMGGLGLLAGFAGLVAVLSAVALVLRRATGRLGPASRIAASFAVVIGLVLLAMLVVRFLPR